MLNDVAYQSNTQEFWNSCAKICDESDYRLFGSFFDGKGQPSQVSAVSHGSSTTRFNGINVIKRVEPFNLNHNYEKKRFYSTGRYGRRRDDVTITFNCPSHSSRRLAETGHGCSTKETTC